MMCAAQVAVARGAYGRRDSDREGEGRYAHRQKNESGGASEMQQIRCWTKGGEDARRKRRGGGGCRSTRKNRHGLRPPHISLATEIKISFPVIVLLLLPRQACPFPFSVELRSTPAIEVLATYMT